MYVAMCLAGSIRDRQEYELANQGLDPEITAVVGL